MKILKVIHGYPPEYNAGSEIYSKILCEGLAAHHDVSVFTRQENSFLPDYSLIQKRDISDERITKYLINIPLMRQRYRYRHNEVDDVFTQILGEIKPDIVHIGHLNHLSTSILERARDYDVPIIFTLHDYWLICPRGQFIQRNPQDKQDPWKQCDGQEDRKCGQFCYAGYFSGDAHEYEEDLHYWSNWVRRRRLHLNTMVKMVDLFIAPSQTLFNVFKQTFNLSSEKLTYLDYGFDLSSLKNRSRILEEAFVFGYIGTHTPQKGIHLLIQAFAKTKGNARLRIWGREKADVTPGLRQMIGSLDPQVQNRIEWGKEYSNSHIVCDVFNCVDAIVVPSIWIENSPLVIHEAQQVGVPVITANVGGMAEYVQHEKNGLLFKFRDVESLAEQMQRLIDSPELTQHLSMHRYLYSENGDIPSISTHISNIEEIYKSQIIKKETNYHGNKTRSMAYYL